MANRRLTAETQRTRRGHGGLIQLSAHPLRSLRLCGERLFPYILAIIVALALCLFSITGGAAQSTQAPARGVIRLRVRPRVEGKEKGLARKRFFLLTGSLEENRALIETISNAPSLSRECYYRSIGASTALIRWLKE